MNNTKIPYKLGNIVNNILLDYGYIDSYLKVEIIKKWPSIVGEKISVVTKCADVREGILYIKVFSSSWRQEISFLKKEILLKIREKTNHSFKDIIFI